MEQNLFVFVVNFLYNLLFYVIIIESTNNVILYTKKVLIAYYSRGIVFTLYGHCSFPLLIQFCRHVEHPFLLSLDLTQSRSLLSAFPFLISFKYFLGFRRFMHIVSVQMSLLQFRLQLRK